MNHRYIVPLPVYRFFRWKIIQPFNEIFNPVDRFYKNLRTFHKRKVHRYEAWNLSDYIAAFVYPLIVEFNRQHKDGEAPMGCPSEIIFKHECNIEPDCKYGYCKHLSEEERNKRHEAAFNEWQDIVNKMQRAFYLLTHDEENESLDDYDKRYKEIQEGLDLFARYFNSLWN